MLYSDNQTGHFFVAASSNDVRATRPVNHKFRILVANGEDAAASDLLDDRLILNKGVKAVAPIYYRKWVVAPMNSVVANTTYSLYFYLENMLGFGLQDRWDIVASYTTGADVTGVSAATVMEAIKNDLIEKIGAKGAKHQDGPIANDFIVELDGTSIVVKENPASKTYRFNELDMRTHDHPYMYDLTLSTYDGNAIWGNNNKVIYAQNTTDIRVKSGMIVKDMEHYFSRNRADIYDLNPNFGASIINELYADENKNYSIVNIHYAFSDGLGFSYRSEKDLNIAVEEANAGDTTNGEAVLANIENPSDAINVAYIYDEASWRANYDMLTSYFAAEKAAGRTPGNKDEWNGDGWLVFNFPVGKYAGKTLAPKYDGDSMNTATLGTTAPYAIYSTTSAADMGSATPVTHDTLDSFDVSKVTNYIPA